MAAADPRPLTPPEPGTIWRHFKATEGVDGLYMVLAVGRSSEAHEEKLVVYLSLRSFEVWVRPLPMFVGAVEPTARNAFYSGPRFSPVSARDAAVAEAPLWLRGLLRGLLSICGAS